jgi:hypothetical protein
MPASSWEEVFRVCYMTYRASSLLRPQAEGIEVFNSFMSKVSPRDKDSRKMAQVNRRRSLRLPQRLGVSCTIVEDGDSMGNLAQVIDLSQSGVQLLTQQRFEPDSCLHLTLSNAAELFRYAAAAIVRSAVVTSDGTHITGCQFLQNLPYDHLCALLA